MHLDGSESMASSAEFYGLLILYDFKKQNLETVKAYSFMQLSKQNKCEYCKAVGLL